MALSSEQALGELAGGALASAYLVSGEEPLGQVEVADAIRSKARQAGVEERIGLSAGTGFDWGRLREEMATLSLFGGRRLVEVDLPTGKPGNEGSKALQEAATLASQDCLLVVMTTKLEKEQRSARWVTALEAAGVHVECRYPERSRLIDWVKRRADRLHLRLSREALAILAERSEGNLFACAQALETLSLLYAQTPVDAEQVLAATGDSARYSVFNLSDASLAGDVPRALRVLAGLRDEGTEPVLVSWSMRRELRLLTLMARTHAKGQGLQGLFGRLRIWPQRQSLYQQTLRRLGPERIQALYAACLAIDRTVKGAERGPAPYDAIAWLVMALSGMVIRPELWGRHSSL